MAAPTNAAKREESPCQPGAVHTWTRSGHRHFPKNKAKNPNFEMSSPPGAE
jgi:hypothetical protein